MERLTYNHPCNGGDCWEIKGAGSALCGDVCIKAGEKGCKVCPLAKAFEQLAAYEDTGLTPEEVEIMRETKADAQFMLTELCGFCDYDRLCELAQAEKDGRLLILPCKIGDEVYLNMDGKTYPLKVQGISVAAGSIGCVIHFGGWPVMNAWGSDFGKILFSTKEEAEAALNKKEVENER